MTADKWLDFVRPGENQPSIIIAASAATAIPNTQIRSCSSCNAYPPPPPPSPLPLPLPHTIQIVAPQPSLTLHLSGSDMSSNQFGLACIKHNKHVRPVNPLPPLSKSQRTKPLLINKTKQQTPPNNSQVLQSKQIIAACFEMQKQMDAEVLACRIISLRIIWFDVGKIVCECILPHRTTANIF
jgi:hypothetical protein